MARAFRAARHFGRIGDKFTFELILKEICIQSPQPMNLSIELHRGLRKIASDHIIRMDGVAQSVAISIPITFEATLFRINKNYSYEVKDAMLKIIRVHESGAACVIGECTLHLEQFVQWRKQETTECIPIRSSEFSGTVKLNLTFQALKKEFLIREENLSRYSDTSSQKEYYPAARPDKSSFGDENSQVEDTLPSFPATTLVTSKTATTCLDEPQERQELLDRIHFLEKKIEAMKQEATNMDKNQQERNNKYFIELTKLKTTNRNLEEVITEKDSQLNVLQTQLIHLTSTVTELQTDAHRKLHQFESYDGKVMNVPPSEQTITEQRKILSGKENAFSGKRDSFNPFHEEMQQLLHDEKRRSERTLPPRPHLISEPSVEAATYTANISLKKENENFRCLIINEREVHKMTVQQLDAKHKQEKDLWIAEKRRLCERLASLQAMPSPAILDEQSSNQENSRLQKVLISALNDNAAKSEQLSEALSELAYFKVLCADHKTVHETKLSREKQMNKELLRNLERVHPQNLHHHPDLCLICGIRRGYTLQREYSRFSLDSSSSASLTHSSPPERQAYISKASRSPPRLARDYLPSPPFRGRPQPLFVPSGKNPSLSTAAPSHVALAEFSPPAGYIPPRDSSQYSFSKTLPPRSSSASAVRKPSFKKRLLRSLHPSKRSK